MGVKKLAAIIALVGVAGYHGCNFVVTQNNQSELEQRIEQLEPEKTNNLSVKSKALYAVLPETVRKDIAEQYYRDQISDMTSTITNFVSYLYRIVEESHGN